MFEDYVDHQVQAATMFESRVPLEERASWQASIRRRAEISRLGLKKVPEHIVTDLHMIDPRLRIRWEFDENCFVVELAYEQVRCWIPVVIWKDEDGYPLPLDNRIIEALRTGDMWKFATPAEYLRFKRNQALEQQRKNEEERQNRTKDAISDLSRKQLEQFQAVDTAIKTGETIIAHGDDLKFLERAKEVSEKRLIEAEN